MPAPTSFEQSQSSLEASLPHYHRREHQILLAGQIEEAIATRTHGLFQAGTGTGKSLALLIPAIIRAFQAAADDEPYKVVVATFNKALQNQYVGDLKFLAEHLFPGLLWAILKGRANYPCLAKIKDLHSEYVTPGQRQVLEVVAADVKADYDQARKVPDREDFPLLSDEEWRAFSMSTAECPGKKHCPFGDKCLAEKAKAQAAEAQVVITNTAYLLQDLILRSRTDDNVQLLGEFHQLIVDEAHTLPDVATGALEDTIGEGSFRVLARDMGAYLMAQGGDRQYAEGIETAAFDLWEQIVRKYDMWAILDKSGKNNPMPLNYIDVLHPEQLGPYFIALYNAIDAAREAMKDTRTFDDNVKLARSKLLSRSANMMDRIHAYTFEEDLNVPQTVRWIERETKKFRGVAEERTYLRSAPLSVAPFLRRAMWDVVPTIMSSATLVGGTRRIGGQRVADFGYLAKTLGLTPGEVMTYDAGSPFDYPRQALLFTPAKEMPSPLKQTEREWKGYAQAVMHRLVTNSGGGALLLFTSRKAMEEAWDALAGQFTRAGMTVLKQGQWPSPELIRRMKEDGNAVLFALRTFFEGVDIQGDALRLVVLDKLPFAAPDQVYDARCEAVNKQFGNHMASFDRITIPMMIMILNQAFGRLIRHINDKGAVAILDSRLNSKSYGRTIMEALPPARRTTEIEEASAFLEGIRPA